MTEQIDHASSSTSIISVNDVASGALLAGKYRVVRVLGHGGMGIVVEAEHVRLGDHVAIKFLSAPHQGGEARERFEREARASVRMRSAHVARVRDIGELDTGQPYIVMELLDGADLAHYLKDTTLEPEAIVDLALQCCEALAEAHVLGIVHRDIKPPNLFITHDGERRILKLLDFGVATGPIDDLQITGTGVVIGTPSYMCPEQMRSSRAAEPHWDLWSLGVVLYEMFERTLPFVCDSFAELAVAVLTQPPRPMTQTPPAIRPIIERCLDKLAANRFLEAGELADALAPHGTPQQAATTRKRIAKSAGFPVSTDRRDLSGPTLTSKTPPPARAKTEIATPPPPENRARITPNNTPSKLAPPMTSAPATPITTPAPELEPARSRRPFVVIAAVVLAIIVVAWIGLRPATPTSTAIPDAAAIAPAIAIDAAIDAPIEIDVTPDASEPPPDARKPPPDARKHGTPIPKSPVDAAPSAPSPVDALTPEQLMKGRS